MTDATAIEEYMIRNQFSKQDLFNLLDWVVSIHGRNLPPQEIAERECKRLEGIRMERQKARVNET